LRADRIGAPCVIDGPINGESFTAYVHEILVRISCRERSWCSAISARRRAPRCAA
jgi:hypothetical protein